MTLQRKITILGFVILAFLSLYLLGNSMVFKLNSSQLSNLITIDVLVTIPFIYFLLIRKTSIPKLTVIPITIIGVLLAYSIIPEDNQQFLSLFKIWILPVIEVCILIFVGFKFVNAVKRFKANSKTETDFYSILKKTCTDHLPKLLVIPFVTEISVMYYGFFYWKKRPLKTNEFTYHKTSGSISLFMAFLLILAVETVGVHYLLQQLSNNTGVWIITILSLYTVLQVLGFVKSIVKRPIIITDNFLLLRYGIMKETAINIKDILAVEFTSRDLKKKSKVAKLSLLGALESHNTILHLSTENQLTGFYGNKKTYKSIAISVDEKEAFKQALKVAKNKAICKEV